MHKRNKRSMGLGWSWGERTNKYKCEQQKHELHQKRPNALGAEGEESERAKKMKTIVKFPLVIRLQVAAREMIVLNCVEVCVHCYVGIYTAHNTCVPTCNVSPIELMLMLLLLLLLLLASNAQKGTNLASVPSFIIHTFLCMTFLDEERRQWRQRSNARQQNIALFLCRRSFCCVVSLMCCSVPCFFVCRFLRFSSLIDVSLDMFSSFFLLLLILQWVWCMSLASPLLLLCNGSPI